MVNVRVASERDISCNRLLHTALPSLTCDLISTLKTVRKSLVIIEPKRKTLILLYIQIRHIITIYEDLHNLDKDKS